MAAEGYVPELTKAVSLLGAALVAVPLFRKLKLGSVLGYIVAGVIIGPFGLKLFVDPDAILHVAELGVVMFLFVIGLEMQPSKLWKLRGDIFGLGAAQVAACGALLTGAGVLLGLPPLVAFVGGMGFTLSSTAIVFQMLGERGETATPQGQRVVSILLLEDLAIVPLLALVAFLAPGTVETTAAERSQEIALAVGAIVALVVIGRWLLNPLFRVLAAAKAREMMTAAALLIVLGAALLMELGGLSMAMGAFLAGVLLSESTFRHQLEADVEPFRGILLGLFFLAVGMSLNLLLVQQAWLTVALWVLGLSAVKMLAIYVVARGLRAGHHEGLYRAVMLGQGGEFAFVLFAAAAGNGILDAQTNALLTATVILSMVLTPLMVLLMGRHLKPPAAAHDLTDVEAANGLHGQVLMIGFGRFGQVASQSLLAHGINIAIIESNPDRIRDAANFGFKIYYGDGTRLDILHASGAGHADAILVCTDEATTTHHIVHLLKAEFPLVKVMARAYDRGHALQLIQQGVDYQLRETVESAHVFGEAALRVLGVDEDTARSVAADMRRRDIERLELQVLGDVYSGKDLLANNTLPAAPLTTPRSEGQVIDTAEPKPER
ncbi:monovalent cation:proton antiporter-2 (CPA2) family protein [Polycyclovorans algicola]|uniref:monovalent cation:proton antiporter-2 (CPA2) family protein n=1 Tax=Polycyclovorans algicola TaxID=616992 RepID=UPI0004A75CD2|nr:monovalent cation:proton antiporter-2 (CPA2) family protein [Polycyclovorans algicola]